MTWEIIIRESYRFLLSAYLKWLSSFRETIKTIKNLTLLGESMTFKLNPAPGGDAGELIIQLLKISTVD